MVVHALNTNTQGAKTGGLHSKFQVTQAYRPVSKTKKQNTTDFLFNDMCFFSLAKAFQNYCEKKIWPFP